MKLGLSSYAYRWSTGIRSYKPTHPMDVEGFIHKAIDFNLQGVQICDNLPYWELSESRLREIRKQVEDQRMFIETGARGSEYEYLKTMLEASSQLGSNLLRVVIEIERNVPEEQVSVQLNTVVEDIQNILDVAKDLNIRLAIENHATFSSEDLLYIIKTIDDDFVGVCLDTMNSILLLEPPLTTAQALIPYAFTVHLKDFTIERYPEYFRIVGVALGEGIVNFPRVIQMLKESKLDPTVHLELYIDRRENEEAIRKWEDKCVAKSVFYARNSLEI